MQLATPAEQPPLQRAADNFNGAEATEAALRALLSAGADVAAANLRGATPLHWAATNRDAEAATAAIRLLLGAGASVHARDRYGETPLHYVDTNRSGAAAAAVVRTLVQAGADVHARDRMLNTPLHAVAAGSPGVDAAAAAAAARALLAAGAECGAVNGEGVPPLLLALERHDGTASPQLLHLLAPPAEGEEARRHRGGTSDGMASVLPRVAQAWRQSLRPAGTGSAPARPGRQR
ncbi:hypothetical protein ABPG77_001842 [Micractinium sp. CCAP 211/92]